jgi:hypothetical protein
MTIGMALVHGLLAVAGAAGMIASANGLASLMEIVRAIRVAMARGGGRP